MDDFLLRALLAGLGVAAVAGPLGCFVVWRRMSYFGATLSHSGLLGVALGLLMGISPLLGILGVSVAVALLLAAGQGVGKLADDTLLGILAHGALALGLVAIGFLPGVRVDLMGYLFGDILAVGQTDLYAVYGGGALVLAAIYGLWQPLMAITVHPEVAQVEGVPVARVRLGFMLLMAVSVAMAMKVVGILLVTSLLVMPAAAARPLARTPEGMAFLATVIGMASVALGLVLALQLDLPAGPAIVVAALVQFAAILGWCQLRPR